MDLTGLEIRKLAPQEVPDPDLPKCPDLNCLYGGRQPECTQKGSGSAQCPDLKVPDLRKTTVVIQVVTRFGAHRQSVRLKLINKQQERKGRDQIGQFDIVLFVRSLDLFNVVGP